MFGREPHKASTPMKWLRWVRRFQGGVLSGDVTDVLLLDVTPLSLGIETPGRCDDEAHRREHGRSRPGKARYSRRHPTASHRWEIHILQGERQMANDNRTLGRFHLDGIPPAPVVASPRSS